MNLPNYLKPYICEQNYAKYTPRDQACWRFIMRSSRHFFKEAAHPVYLDGLRQTGIPTDRIPRIEEMNEALGRFGWGAVGVSGFIPPAAFLDFLARKVLPIATDMRILENVAYTPAPDIVHEAAGHAPIIADESYSKYLTQYALMAKKAIYSDEDVRVFEAIRLLSDLKENPDATKAEIQQAEKSLEEANAAVSSVSEAAEVARMFWWTAEYGLLQDGDGYRIFGAGLLSSVGESQACFGDHVKKVLLTKDCVKQGYDITEPQPQLFVAKNFDHLSEVLKDYEKTMAVCVGGVESLVKAKEANAVTTTVFQNDMMISGVLDGYELDDHGNLQFAKWSGPVQIAQGEVELSGHGCDYHAHGFSTPLGRIHGLPASEWAQFSNEELSGKGMKEGEISELHFDSGFTVTGRLKKITRDSQGKLMVLSWEDCKVTKGDQVYFDPSWGPFDQILGEEVLSIFGGPADFEKYGEENLGSLETHPARQSPYTDEEIAVFKLYEDLRSMRENGNADESLLKVLADKALLHTNEWLLSLEILELAHTQFNLGVSDRPWLEKCNKVVLAPEDKEILRLARQGLQLI